MENIYSQTESERNSIVGLPDGFAEKAGNTLYSWLGSLWTGVHRGDGMVRGLQAARGIRLAQLYLDILEAAKLQDRFGAPVFHRELWHPVVVKLSTRDTAQANMIRIGGDGKVGSQPSGSPYGQGTVLAIGRLANFEDYVTYPIGDGIAGGAACIVDNVVNPSVVLERGEGKDFEIKDGSIVFPKGNDPFADGSPFEKIDIPELVEVGGEQVSDSEVVLWAADVLVDRNYIADHLSYPLGADAPSSDIVKRVLNAAWSSVAGGLTPELVRTLMAAMLNIPVVQTARETVLDIVRETDGDGTVVATDVVTDRMTYRLSPKAKLVKGITSGTVLKKGDLLDESLRVYPFLNAPGWKSATTFSVPVEQDIPSVVIPRSIIRAKTEYGVYAKWNPSRVKQDEQTPEDANGNPRLYFDVGGMPSDVRAFWEDVWEKAEASMTSMESILGAKGSLVSPAGFFVDNLVGQNTLFVVVDVSQIDDASMMHNPMFFDMLYSVVPSAIRLFVVEHVSAGEGDTAEMGDSDEGRSVAASLPNPVSEEVRASDELVSMRFFRPPPEKTGVG